MIYLDRILDHEPGVFLKSSLMVSGNLDAIAGHFPERAIYPGSHLMQACAQSAIILFQMGTSPLSDDEITLVGSMKSRFTRIVVPGDHVVFDVRAERTSGDVFFFAASAKVDDVLAASFKGNLIRTTLDALGRQLW
ncbi:3-hydroxyacyl-ACP dehydratase FabZ family protein [Nonomuraea sp. NPDC049480]|uniref:3-hydroxyacyl-ACP dehydratase FabZ family protein n=1 Tax=Nonomuraea sp. NPDC049480 TaxID=3364353 RepID=UPI00378EBA48